MRIHKRRIKPRKRLFFLGVDLCRVNPAAKSGFYYAIGRGGRVSEKDFQQEVIDRLARIETKQDATMATVCEHTRLITDQGKEIVRIDASTKSAHHRISGICATAGAFGAIAGTAAQVIAAFWPKSSGHG